MTTTTWLGSPNCSGSQRRVHHEDPAPLLGRSDVNSASILISTSRAGPHHGSVFCFLRGLCPGSEIESRMAPSETALPGSWAPILRRCHSRGIGIAGHPED